MLNAIFLSDDGRQFVFGVNGGVAFDMDVGSGSSVTLGTAQGFSQIGESVFTQSVSGRNISIVGCIYKNVIEKKRLMRNVFSPFVSGTLTINEKYYCKVYVKEPPSFSTTKNDGRFTMQFFCPTPYFFSTKRQVVDLNSVTNLFSFPVIYNNHTFGSTAAEKYVNVQNTGDVEVPFSFTVTATDYVNHIVLKNLDTFEHIGFHSPSEEGLNVGDRLTVYRDLDGTLNAEKISGDTVENVLSWISISSSLFKLHVGNNLIAAETSTSAALPEYSTSIYFNPAYWSVFEE